MSILLPNNFNQLVTEAIRQFWTSRTTSSIVSQEGGRGSVIAGKNLDGFSALIKVVAQHCGMPKESIITLSKRNLTIPGFFRPTKMWDSVVVYKGKLIAAFELKSQVGPSFGNNFNNRAEESIGSAKDFWTAYREKAFEYSNFSKQGIFTENVKDIKQPFLGYLMLLEKCPNSTCNIKVEEAHFRIFPEFKDSSYAKRYQLLCEKLVAEGLYSSASLILSDRESGMTEGIYSSPSETLNPTSLFADFAAKLLSAIETYK